jgi:hypothetical protein
MGKKKDETDKELERMVETDPVPDNLVQNTTDLLRWEQEQEQDD